MKTIKLSVLSLLLFSSFNVLGDSTTECRARDQSIIPNSSYKSATSCVCKTGYSGSITGDSSSGFLGACTLVEDSAGISSAVWVTSIVAIGFTSLTGLATAAGYYIYRVKIAKLSANSEMNELGGDIQSIANDEAIVNDGASGSSIDSIYSLASPIERTNYDLYDLPTNFPSRVDNMVEGDYDLARPIDELSIEGHYAEPKDIFLDESHYATPYEESLSTGLPNPAEASLPNDYLYATVSKKKFIPELEFQDSGEEIDSGGLGEQVKDVQEHIIEDTKISEEGTGEIEEAGAYFEGQTISNPNIANVVPTNDIITDPEYQSVSGQNKTQDDLGGCE